MSDPEKLYTLHDARKIVRREVCASKGHEIGRVALQRNVAGFVSIEFWACGNCDVRVTLSYPD